MDCVSLLKLLVQMREYGTINYMYVFVLMDIGIMDLGVLKFQDVLMEVDVIL